MNLFPLIAAFERVTGAKVKFCMEDPSKQLVFVVEAGQMGLALGRKASNVPKLEYALRRSVKIVAYADTVQQFALNLIFPIRDVNASMNGDVLELECMDKKVKGMLMGRSGQNIPNYEAVIRNFFPVSKIVVK